MDKRAVSELVGFSLTFAIVLVSVALISTVGFGQLTDFRDSQQLENAEQTFEIFGDSFDRLEEGASETLTEAIDLSSGSIEIEEGSTATIKVYDSGGGSLHSETIPLNALVYTQDSTNISYENGATYRSESQGSVMNTDPGFVCNDDVGVLSFVTLESSESGGISGGEVEISAERNGTELLYPIDRSGGTASASKAAYVTVTVSSPREDPWQAHFESAANWTVSGSTIQCGSTSDPLDRIYVRQTNVSLALSN